MNVLKSVLKVSAVGFIAIVAMAIVLGVIIGLPLYIIEYSSIPSWIGYVLIAFSLSFLIGFLLIGEEL